MNPVSSSLLLVVALLLIAALVAGVVVGLLIARSRTQVAVDAALAQAGHARELELTQARERLRAGEQAAAAVQAELERARTETRGARAELAAAHETVLRAAASDAQKSQQVASLNERLADLEQKARDTAAQLDARNVALQTAHAELAQARTRADAERTGAQEKLQLLTDAKTELSNQFKTLASDILEEKAKRFAEQNQQNLGTLLDPLRTQLSEFKGKVEEVYVQEGKERVALSEQVRQLMELNRTLSNDANNLTKALKGSAKAQGNWGELILERVLEASGLEKGRVYHVQVSQRDAEGNLQQPDVVIDLPQDRKLVVDAKVSLLAYDRYASAASDDDRLPAMRQHLDSVRAHIKGLSAKNYQALYGVKSLDMVVMFVPIEPAFMLAVTSDESLFMEAWQRNVLLVSPSTLLFVVRTIAHLWRQEAQTRNAQDIARRGAELYDKLAAFVGDLQKVGAKLKDAQSAYEEAEKRLSTGRGNVIRQAEMLRELGVKATKALPNALVDASEGLDASTGNDVDADAGEGPAPIPQLPPMSLFDETLDPDAPLN
ncbi:MAG: DNA recombination protein RmuC [Burkholderiaceae bacterium]